MCDVCLPKNKSILFNACVFLVFVFPLKEVSEPVVSGIDQHWDVFNIMPKKAANFRT